MPRKKTRRGGTGRSLRGSSFTSTDAQNNFGQVLSRVSRDGRVFITKYDRPEAVVMSMAEYDRLTGRETIDLEALEQEFDAMLEQMQQAPQRAAIDRLFSTKKRRSRDSAGGGA